MNKTLLLVDDEAPVRRALRRSLAADGYHILEADCGEDALKLLAGHPVDAILTDQRMPNMSGTELLRRARRDYPHIARIMISGQCDLDSLAQAVNDADLHQFVHKPWDELRLRGVVQKILEASRQAPEAGQSPVATAQPDHSYPSPLSLVTDFNRALCEDRITHNYLPLITTDSGEVTAVEAVLKWQHPDLGTALHEDLLVLGDTCNADKILNTRYLCDGLEQLRQWHAQKLHHLQLMVRLSERMLRNPFTPQLLRQLLSDYGLPATRLIFTFPAANLRQAPDGIWSNLHKLQQAGATLCLDDFALDNVHMMLLESLPIQLLRFNPFDNIIHPAAGSTIHPAAGKGGTPADYRALVDCAHERGIAVIAGGIHQADNHYQMLISGCNYLQGSLYGETRSLHDLSQVFSAPPLAPDSYH